MRLAFAMLLGVAGLSVAQPPKAPMVKLPDGFSQVVTVEGITEYKLKNGLRVILLPDASQPKVTVNCTIFVGSRHEGYGETGMAHLLEHMVFKGCPKFPDVPKALDAHAANFNGTTALDRTNYFQTMPATEENLEFGIELEADRMMNSFIKKEDLEKEFTVVRSEFERGENNPIAILYQRMQATAYEWHNYGKSTIGNKTDIERVPVENLRAFYKKYYRPDNALLVIAGKFDEAKALELIGKHFGPIQPPEQPIPATYTEEPPQDGERFVTLRRVGGSGATGVVYHIPAASHPDYAAVEVLANVLSTPPTGRLYKALVETKKAVASQGFARNCYDPGTLTVFALTKPEDTEAARDALLQVTENIGKDPITKDEVERAKRELLQQRERTLTNSQLFAIGVSDWAGCGDWRLFFVHRDRLEKITAEDVNRVAAQYLTRANRTVGVFIPTKQAERAQVPQAPDLAKLLAGYTGRDAMTAGEVFDPTPENIEKRVVRGEINGVKTSFLAKKTRGETVNASVQLNFGSAESLAGQGEAVELMASLMDRGTKSLSREQIKEAFDKLNAVVSISATPGTLRVSLQTKRANLPAVLVILKQCLREANFPEKEFEVAKREELEGLAQAKTDPQTLATIALERKLEPYPPSDVRYTPTIAEAIERYTKVTVDNVKAVYTQLGGTSGQIAVVGDFDPDATKKAFADLLTGWTTATPYKRIDGKVFAVKGGIEKINTPDKANAVYTAGLPIRIRDTDADYAAMNVGNYILGVAPLASRLSVKVRGQEGLSYGVGSRFTAGLLDDAGRFGITAITNPMNMGKVETLIAEEVQKFVKDGPSGSELEQAKKSVSQARRQQLTSDAGLAGSLNRATEAGRTMTYEAELEKKIELLQPGDIQRAFQKNVKPDSLVIIQAGDFDKKK